MGGTADESQPDIASLFDVKPFRSLHQPMRSWALVGCYMGHFAFLEDEIGRGLRVILDLDPLAGALVARNMGMIQKIQALRTAVNLAVVDGAKRYIDDLLKKAIGFAEERNDIAHNPFGESERSDGVRFFLVDAKRKFANTEIDWSVDEFEQHIDAVKNLTNKLAEDRVIQEFKFTAKLFRLRDNPQTFGADLAKILSGTMPIPGTQGDS